MRRNMILVILVLAGMALYTGCGDDDSTSPPPPPVVSGIDRDFASPGDTLTISGSNFSTVISENTVTFRNPLSATKPFSATASRLRVIVDRDAVTGPVTVSTAGGSDTSTDLDVRRGIGDVLVYGLTGANNILELPNPTVTTRYLVVPHATNASVQYADTLAYSIQSSSAPPVAVVATHDGAAGLQLHMSAHEWFETQRWERAQEDIERFGVPRETVSKEPEASRAPAAFRQFRVLKTTLADQNSASSYALVTAELRYSGTKCLVYADVDTLPTGNFTQAHFNMFGQAYDSSIEATNVSYFGSYSDVDGNGKLIMLVSPVVNRLEECAPGDCSCGFIAGFFNPRDLYTSPPVPSGTTNHAEIIYLLAADPTGVWDCSFPVDETAAENLGTITHEHEHLISFSTRLFQQGGVAQVTWLEEGMAHMAEDLNGDNSSNISRGKLYRASPWLISLENNTAPLQQRGGIYLMLRLLVDRYGTGILKQIVQSKCTGRACIQNVTGMGFTDAFAQFLAAQYLSGQGITADERYNYTSIDLADFGPLPTSLHAAGGADVNGNLKRTSGKFHIFTGTLGQNSQFQFNDLSGKAGLRNVIVRIQ